MAADDKLQFRRRHRLTRATEYRDAYCQGCRRSAGPITVYLRPNGLPEHRLGLSVGRRVGGAVVRNQIKRRVREAFRLDRPGYPLAAGGAFDVVVQVRPHRPLPLSAYRELLARLARKAAEAMANREAEDAPP